MSLAPAQAVREFATERGSLRVVVISERAPATDSIAVDTVITDTSADTASYLAEDIVDFTSLAEMNRQGDALLDVDFIDNATGAELRFPVKFSQLRAYRLLHPLEYQDGTLDERTIAMFSGLVGELRVHMTESAEAGAKQ
jgi:hypothetical protein